MFERYVKEFMAIVQFLLGKETGCVDEQKFLTVSKAKLVRMMDRNAFETSYRKLKVWRDLRWIVANEGHYTSVVRRDGHLYRTIKIDLRLYRCMLRLLPPPKDRDCKQESECVTAN